MRSRRVSTIFLPGWVGGREKESRGAPPPRTVPFPPRNAAVAEAAGTDIAPELRG